MKRIVIIGPESTGKSTLCRQLAEHFNTIWCPEYAREYLEKNGKDYSYDDLLLIAKGQLALEERLAATVPNDLYFIDTDMYVMKVWCEFVFGKCHQFILDQLAVRRVDIYLLCNIDLPWSFDELREYPDEQPRKKLYRMYRDILENQDTPWAEISGSYEERLSHAIEAVNRIT